MPNPRTTSRTGSAARAVVHLALIATATTSLILEPTLSLHVLLGLAFVAAVVAHVTQRRRTSRALLRRLSSARTLPGPAGRLALSDSLLAILTVAMLVSGLWDWLGGHPTRIRWHAITGVALTGYLLVHTVRRRHRITRSSVR